MGIIAKLAPYWIPALLVIAGLMVFVFHTWKQNQKNNDRKYHKGGENE